MRRRQFLHGAAASGAVLLGTPRGALASALGGASASQVATRESRLFPGTFLVHADLHNHSLFSDGDGDPDQAFVSMRDNGLDVAALTDHAVLGGPLGVPFSACGSAECTSIRGIDETSWAETAAFADAADAPGSFTAIRGFEWSSPTLGHMNVWFSDEWIDPERTAGLVGVEGIELLTDEIPFLGPLVGEPLADLVGSTPLTGLTMAPFFDWLQRAPGSGGGLPEGLLGGGGGLDGIAGFNHPGREPGRFGQFTYDARLADQVVSLELFNRTEDYLFEGTDSGEASPLVQCLDAGWRPGILGVTDEHGTDWGAAVDKGRGGLWVTELSRAGVRAALERRSFFATRERGLRFDASARSGDDAPVRMGSTLGHDTGPVTFEIDIDKGVDWVGTPLVVQVLSSGGAMPTVLEAVDVVAPAPSDPVLSITVDVSRDDTSWLVLRITDPAGEADGRATGPFADAGRAVAYASPFHLVDRAAPVAPTTSTPPPGTPSGGASPVSAATDPRAGGPTTGSLPATGGTTPMVGGVAALGAAAIAALASRRLRPPGEHGHEHRHEAP